MASLNLLGKFQANERPPPILKKQGSQHLSRPLTSTCKYTDVHVHCLEMQERENKNNTHE